MERTTVTVLVTGANSGLGFSLSCRLIDEFLLTRPQDQTLHLLFSTRDTKKSSETLKRLNAHLEKTIKEVNGKIPGFTMVLGERIKLEGVQVDLTKLSTIKELADTLVKRGQHLDAAIWNAGISGWLGLNWFKATWNVMTDMVQSTSYPSFLNCDVGLLAKPQITGKNAKGTEPKLAQVFLSNVLGHYMLTHWLAPILDSDSRIIWISSTTALSHTFNVEDIQGIKSTMAYESSKRLTDCLALTSRLPSTKPYTDEFFSGSNGAPKMYATHPGVMFTAIMDLGWFLNIFYILALYIARWLGSPWILIDSYKGAVSAAFAALAPPEQLDNLEVREGQGKWGSAAGVWGDERVMRTEVEGWGYCGKVDVVPSGSATTKGGRYRGPLKVVTNKETREEFEVTGRRIWKEMEELRVEWEGLLKDC